MQNARPQDDDVDRQLLPDDQLGNDSTDQTDSVEFEQAEDLPEDLLMSNLSLSMSLESPQVTEGPLIHSFTTSSEVGI